MSVKQKISVGAVDRSVRGGRFPERRSSSGSARDLAPLVAFLAMTLAASSVSAQSAAVLVTGDASEHQRNVVDGAVKQAIANAAWSVDSAGFGPDDIAAIGKCAKLERPWSCIEPSVRARGLSALVIVRVDLVDSKDPAVVAQIVQASNRVAPEEFRRCEARCTDATLIETTNVVMSALLRRVGDEAHPTPPVDRAPLVALLVRSTPAGAAILVDGQQPGVAGTAMVIHPGHHVIAVSLEGYRTHHRELDAVKGEAQELDVELERESRGSSSYLPISLVAGGVALGAACLAYQLTRDAPATFEQPRYLLRPWAIGGVVVGTAAVGVGLYLWLRHKDDHASAPTAAIIPGGAVIGWSRSFQ